MRHIASVSLTRIRVAVPGDLPALRRLFKRSSLSVEAFRDELLANPEELELSNRGVTEGRTRVAVAADGALLGFITRLPLGAGVLEVEDLFVDPDHMREGVARRLIEDLTAAAKRDGTAAIQVTANPHALAFYQSVGFVHIRDTETRFGLAPRMELTVSGEESSTRTSEAESRGLPPRLDRSWLRCRRTNRQPGMRNERLSSRCRRWDSNPGPTD